MQLSQGAEVTSLLRLNRQLGSGAMGTIWAAEHASLGRQVALKFMAAEFQIQNEHAYARFQREAEVLEGIEHPHIVRLLGSGQATDGTPYIMLELMDGEPLVDFLEREGLFELPIAISLVAQLSSALAALHRRNLVHRDLKLENVFIKQGPDGLQLKLFDFGLAKVRDSPRSRKPLTGLGTQVGTSEYMSPEQILSSKDADPSADLWAMTVIMYLLLLGQFPFSYQGLGQLIRLVRSKDFERPSELRDDIPKSIDTWFERAFNADQALRFGNAEEQLACLHAAAAGADTTATPVTSTSPLHDPPSPFPVATSAAAPNNTDQTASTAVQETAQGAQSTPVSKEVDAFWVFVLALVVTFGIAIALVAAFAF